MTILNGAINPNPMMDVEKLLHRDLIRGILTVPFTPTYSFSQETEGSMITMKSIPFYLTKAFNFSFQNEWGDMLPVDKLEGLMDFLNLFSTISSHTTSRQGNLQSKIANTKVWKKSTFSGFTIDAIFVSTDRSVNPLEIIKAIAAGALPSEGNSTLYNLVSDALRVGASKLSKMVTFGNFDITENQSYKDFATGVENVTKHIGMTAPYGYSPKFETSDNNWRTEVGDNCTCAIKIGQWFHATKLVVESIGNISLSKEVIKKSSSEMTNARGYGYPLYAECTIRLIPYTLITASDFANYFSTPRF